MPARSISSSRRERHRVSRVGADLLRWNSETDRRARTKYGKGFISRGATKILTQSRRHPRMPSRLAVITALAIVDAGPVSNGTRTTPRPAR